MPIAATNTIVRAIVPKQVAQTIARMARASGKSKSAVIAEFLTEVEPVLRRLAGMLEVAKSQQGMWPKGPVAELEAALDEMSGNATDVMDRLEKAIQLPLQPSRAQRRAKPGASGATARLRRRRLPPV